MKKTFASATVAASILGGAAAGALFAPGLAGAQEGDDTEHARSSEHGERAERSDGLAEVLGMTVDELREAQRAGRTLAELATEQGVSVDEVINHLVEAATARIQEGVESGRLTQEQADERLADLEERITERVNSAEDREHRGHRHRGHRLRSDIAAAAESVGLDTSGLREAREQGQSLADIAAEQGVDVQSLIDAVVTQREARLAEAVADGRVSQERADEISADLVERVTAMINGEFERPGRGD